ncbi:hypothetical protein D3C78_761650 [compost metagenome]
MLTLVERLQAKEDRPGIWRVGELKSIQPRKRDRIIHALGIHPDFAHFANHRIGACQRRSFRHFYATNQIQLILRRNKSAGYGFKHGASRAEQQQINRKYRATTSERFTHQPLITVRTAMEKAVKWPENPAEQTVNQPGRIIFRRTVRLQQQGSQRRGERQ